MIGLEIFGVYQVIGKQIITLKDGNKIDIMLLLINELATWRKSICGSNWKRLVVLK